MATVPDLYRILQVDPAAEREVIRAAYVCLSKKHHPDAGGIAERTAALNEAWAVLGDPARRVAYDASRPARAMPAAATAAWSDTGEARAVYAAPPGSVRQSGTSSTLDFGRYAGWTLESLAREDPDYLEWLARAPRRPPVPHRDLRSPLGAQYERAAVRPGRRLRPAADGACPGAPGRRDERRCMTLHLAKDLADRRTHRVPRGKDHRSLPGAYGHQ